MDVSIAAALLDEFGKLPARVARPQTFMEIAGYPHYENVCSNFLAFFFEPEGSHGLGSLFLDALLDSVGITNAVGGFGGNVSVEREVVTGEGNRIDLLMKSDSRVALIENKIFAAVDNPFEDYTNHLDGLRDQDGVAYESANKHKVLLTLHPTSEGAAWGFVNCTHNELAGAVRSSLGYYVSGADTRYLTLMLDFLNTLEHLGERTRMNQSFVKLLAEQETEVEKFLSGVKDVRDEAREKARVLGTCIDLQASKNVRQLDWSPNPNYSSSHFLQHRILLDEETYVVVDTRISPKGWEIRIFSRGDRRALGSLRVSGLPNQPEIPFEADGYFTYPAHFAYTQDIKRVAPVVQDIVEELSAQVALSE